ncbi:MAG: Rieske 2Fe-2S domain-containing protein [Ilumatobacteraceae bacterium]
MDVGAVTDFVDGEVAPVSAGTRRLAVSRRGDEVAAISGICNHAGGPLGSGRLSGDYVVCPWHGWKFHRVTGMGKPGFEQDHVPAYPVRVANGRVLVDVANATRRGRQKHEPHPLSRDNLSRQDGPIRVAGISTTVMNSSEPRYSGSEALLQHALTHASNGGCETRLIRLNDLKFRACEGYYSKSAHACTWPCTITQFDPADELTEVYEALVHWADVVIVATPIRWGKASSLYFRMAERLNCVQNQITIANRVLIHNKVASFIIIGGQDNVQGVAGDMLGYFAELGFHFPSFPYIAHTEGWSAENLERNVRIIKNSESLRRGAEQLAQRSIDLATRLIATEPSLTMERGGRKAYDDRFDSESSETDADASDI